MMSDIEVDLDGMRASARDMDDAQAANQRVARLVGEALAAAETYAGDDTPGTEFLDGVRGYLEAVQKGFEDSSDACGTVRDVTNEAANLYEGGDSVSARNFS